MIAKHATEIENGANNETSESSCFPLTAFLGK